MHGNTTDTSIMGAVLNLAVLALPTQTAADPRLGSDDVVHVCLVLRV